MAHATVWDEGMNLLRQAAPRVGHGAAPSDAASSSSEASSSDVLAPAAAAHKSDAIKAPSAPERPKAHERPESGDAASTTTAEASSVRRADTSETDLMYMTEDFETAPGLPPVGACHLHL